MSMRGIYDREIPFLMAQRSGKVAVATHHSRFAGVVITNESSSVDLYILCVLNVSGRGDEQLVADTLFVSGNGSSNA